MRRPRIWCARCGGRLAAGCGDSMPMELGPGEGAAFRYDLPVKAHVEAVRSHDALVCCEPR